MTVHSQFLPYLDLLTAFGRWFNSPDEKRAAQALQKIDLLILETGTPLQKRALANFETFRRDCSPLAEVETTSPPPTSVVTTAKRELEGRIYQLLGPQLSSAELAHYRNEFRKRVDPNIIYYWPQVGYAKPTFLTPKEISIIEWRGVPPKRWVSDQYLLTHFYFDTYSGTSRDYLRNRLAFYERGLNHQLLTPRFRPLLIDTIAISGNSGNTSPQALDFGYQAIQKGKGILGQLRKVCGTGLSAGLLFLSFKGVFENPSSQRGNLLLSAVLNLYTPWPLVVAEAIIA